MYSLILSATVTTNPLGIRILQSFFILIFVIAVVQYPLGKKLAVYLQRKDQTYSGGIVPSKYAFIHFGMLSLFVMGFLTGMLISGYNAGVGLLIIQIAFTIIFIRKQTTYLSIENKQLLLKEGKKTTVIDFSSIDWVSWGRSSIPYNRRLSIKLKNGLLLAFEQENYWGLEDMYNQLAGQRDGLCEP